MSEMNEPNKSEHEHHSEHSHSHSRSHSRKHRHKHKRHRSTAYKVFSGFLIALIALIIAAAAFFAYLCFKEYKPPQRLDIEVEEGTKRDLPMNRELKVLSWNTGYGALGDNADFFMDGGKMVKTASIQRVTENITAIRNQISEIGPDVLFLQEVDFNSDRSYHIDESRFYQAAFSSCDSAEALNFYAEYVPYPIPPIGHVESGLMTVSAYSMENAERIQLPCPFKWPIRVANMKRCLLITRIPLAGSGHELVLVNLHLEAYDDGEGKIAQTEMLRSILEEEEEKGNYVIAGGDFNQVFSNVDDSAYPAQEGQWSSGQIDVTQFSDSWQFLMDNSVPSCRSLKTPYLKADKETFQYYLIDGFIVSGNLDVTSLETIDEGFVNSDHNPVLLTCRFKE